MQDILVGWEENCVHDFCRRIQRAKSWNTHESCDLFYKYILLVYKMRQ